MRRLLLATTFGIVVLCSPALAAENGRLSGYVVKLAEKTDQAQPQTVNVGGLVIVVVRDSGSRPPQDVSVVAPDSLAPLGVVRGVQNDQGVALMGGGYTWHLFKPAQAGPATVKVAYTENGDGGKRVERNYAVSVQ